METKKIVMLAGKGQSTNILYNELRHEFNISAVILENPVGKKNFLKNRIKKLGYWQVLGQIFFQLIIVKALNIISYKRKKEILKKYQLDDSGIPEKTLIHVNSVNDDECLRVLNCLSPDLVIVNGTRIISKDILDIVKATFINMHAGITPTYRGVHGGYWALVNNDADNFGVTIHLVNAGIDTGSVLFQKKIIISKNDNFVTYPFLQLAEGIPFMKKALSNIIRSTAMPNNTSKIGKLWYHPTIWQYLYHRLKKGIK